MQTKCKLYSIGGVSVDERGSLKYVNDFDFENVKRFYQVENHEKGFIRAWHGHKYEGKYVYVVKGSAWIGVVDMNDNTIVEKFVLSDKSPKVLFIPPRKYNGAQTLEEGTIIMYFSTATIPESREDDIRLPYEQFPIFEKEYR
jgi:dTDP-4-dehydrorhamnose 3,5-epimerase-like enzyme